MSVIIFASTPTLVVVASDSQNSGNSIHHHANKIYQYHDDLIMYAVGNAAVAITLFNVLNKNKQISNERLTFPSALEFLRSLRDEMEGDELFAPVTDACIGVCGISNDTPRAVSILVDPKDHNRFEKITQPRQELNFDCLPPKDYGFHSCCDLFIQCCQGMQPPIQQDALINVCVKTVQGIGDRSHYVDQNVQYWSYDLVHQQHVSNILPLDPILY